MPYTPTEWNNNRAPALDATNLNKIETGIADSTATADAAAVAADIWTPGAESASPLVTAYTPETGRLSIAGIEMGDTGWRDIGSLLRPEWDLSGPYDVALLRRRGSRVDFEFRLTAVTPSTSLTGQAAPAGFRPLLQRALISGIAWTSASNAAAAPATVKGTYIATTGWRLDYALTAGGGLAWRDSYNTPDPWPSTLPGSPPAVQLPEPRD